MKKISFLTVILALIVISWLFTQTKLVENLWGMATGRGYIIPSESSIFSFKVNKMNYGSGEWWLYGEDNNNYYSKLGATNEKPYILISKPEAKNCQNFDKLNYKTWCQYQLADSWTGDPTRQWTTQEKELAKQIIGDYWTKKDALQYLEQRAKILPKLKKMPLKELLSNVKKLPDRGGWYPMGDYYAEEIMNRGDSVVPKLIEIVLDDKTPSKVRLFDAVDYKIGDVAVHLISYATTKGFSLDKYLINEYEPLRENTGHYAVFISAYDEVIGNPKGRVSLYNYLKKWEKENYFPPNSLPQTQADFYQRLADSAMGLTKQIVIYDPSYFSIDYPNGDVPANKGVCTDVVIRAYRKMGIDLQKEVHEDIRSNFDEYPKIWKLTKPDKNIDHRRVPNLMVFFKRHGTVKKISQNPADYQPGDIVSWDLGGGLTHIGIVSNKKTSDKSRFLIIHNIGAGQVAEDILFDFKIIGHYSYRKNK